MKGIGGNKLVLAGAGIALVGVLLLAARVIVWLSRQALVIIAIGAVLMLVGLVLTRKGRR